MNAGRHAEAIAILRSALEKNDESDLAMCFLGMALQLAGYGKESESFLQQVVDANGQQDAVALAKSLLTQGE